MADSVMSGFTPAPPAEVLTGKIGDILVPNPDTAPAPAKSSVAPAEQNLKVPDRPELPALAANAPELVPTEKTPDVTEFPSSALTENVDFGTKEVLAVSNSAKSFSNSIAEMTGLNKAFPQIARDNKADIARTQRLIQADGKAQEWALGFTEFLTHGALSIAADVPTGGMIKTKLATMLSPKLYKVIAEIPDFALGQGARRFAHSLATEGDIVRAGVELISGVFDGTLMGKGPVHRALKEGGSPFALKTQAKELLHQTAAVTASLEASSLINTGRHATPEEWKNIAPKMLAQHVLMTGWAGFQKTAHTAAGTRLAEQIGSQIMHNKFKREQILDVLNEGVTAGYSPGEMDALLDYHYYLVEQYKLLGQDMRDTGIVGPQFDPEVDMPAARRFMSVSEKLSDRRGLVIEDADGKKLAVDVNGRPLPEGMPPAKKTGGAAIGSTNNPLSVKTRGLFAIKRVVNTAVADGDIPKWEARQLTQLLEDWSTAVPASVEDLAVTIRDPKTLPNLGAFGVEQHSGEYYYRIHLIELLTGHEDMGGTGAHEFGHSLTALIPDRMVPWIKEQFEAERLKFREDNPQITFEMWEKFSKYGVISDQAIPGSIAAWKGLGNYAYRFRNIDEFWAEQVRFIFEDVYRNPDDIFRPADKIPDYMKDVQTTVRDLARSQAKDIASFLKSVFDKIGEPAAQRIYSKMMKGQIRTGTEGFVTDALSLFYPNEVRSQDDTKKQHGPKRAFKDVDIRRDLIQKPIKLDENASVFDVFEAMQGDYQPGRQYSRQPENIPKPPMAEEVRDEMFAALLRMDEGMFRGEPAGRYAGGSINIYRHWSANHNEAMDVLDIIYNATKEQVDKARGVGKTNYEVTKEAMKDAKANPPTVLSTRNLLKRMKDIDVDVTRHRMGLMYTVQRLIALKAKLLGDDVTDMDVKNYKDWMEFTAEYEKNMAGVASWAGRLLQSFKISVLATDIDKVTTIDELFKIVSKKKGSPWGHGYVELFKGWMFMRKSSQIANLVGNILNPISKSIEDMFTVGFGKVYSSEDRMTAMEAAAGVVGRAAAVPNALSYNWDLVHKSIDTFHEDPTVDGLVKAEKIINSNSVNPYQDRWGGQDQAFSSKTLYGPMDPNATAMEKIIRKSLDLLGVASRVSLQGLGLADNFFREVGYLPAVRQIAVREGLKSGLRGDELKAYQGNMVQAHQLLYEQNLRPLTELEKEMVDRFVGDGKYHEEALGEAAEAVYNRDWKGRTGIVGELSVALNNILNTSSAGPLLTVGLFPVFKTPMELLRWSVQHTPILHKFSKTMRDDISAGGRRRDKAYAKLAYGTMLYVLASTIYFNGQLAGTPDSDQKAVNRTARIQPNSVKIGGYTFDYTAFQPLAAMFSLAANSWYALQNSYGASEAGVHIFDQTIPFDQISNKGLQKGDALAAFSSDPKDWKEIEKTWGTGGSHWKFDEFRNFMYLSFLAMYADAPMNKGFKDMIDSMRGITGAERMVKNKVPTLLPFNGLVSEIQAARDPLKREVLTAWDAIRKSYSPQRLRPELDPIFGHVIPVHARLGGVIKTTKIAEGPAAQELVRLQVPISDMDRKTLKGVELSDEQGYKLLENVAQLGLKEYMDDLVQSDFYKNMHGAVGSVQPGTQGWYLKQVVDMHRRIAKTYLSIEDDNKILEESIRKKILDIPPSAINNGETLGWGRYINTLNE